MFESLDVSKDFDKVWHEDVIYKLMTIVASDIFLTLFQSSLDNRYQRVLLNGEISHWKPIKESMSQ